MKRGSIRIARHDHLMLRNRPITDANPRPKIFLDKFIESRLDRAVEDRNRANHPPPIRRAPLDAAMRDAACAKNAASRSRADAPAVAKHRSRDLDAPSRVAIDAQRRTTRGETDRTAG
jgi:hypothetical protein